MVGHVSTHMHRSQLPYVPVVAEVILDTVINVRDLADVKLAI